MQKVTSSSATQAKSPVFSSRNCVALNEHVHQSTCSAVDTHVQKSNGAAAPAAANGKRSAQVHNQRESSSQCTSQANTAHNWTLNRRDKYRLQRLASAVLTRTPDWGRNRVAVCSRHKLRYGAEGAHLGYSESEGRAWLEGLATCDSPWTCAVCASRIGEEKADDVRRIENYARDKGLSLSLLTLTSHHTRETNIAELIALQAEALKLFWAGREAQRLKKEWGLIGTIRAFEITHSASAGFHPHYHYLIVSERKLSHDERAELADVLYKRWVECSTKVGLSKPSLKGFDLRTGINAAQYVAKWGLAREMSKGTTKVARGAQSRNMWQILSDAEKSPADAALWAEYAKATRGKSQQHWSPSLKAILNEILEEEEQAELESDAEPNDTEYVFLTECELLDLYTCDLVQSNWCNLFELVEQFGLGYVRDYLRRRKLKGYEYHFFENGREPFTFDDVVE